MRRLVLLLLSLVIVPAALAGAEQLEMVTYYPAPGGVGGGEGPPTLDAQGRLHAVKATVGSGYAPPEDGGSVSNDDIDSGELLIEKTFSIGTHTSAATLHVEGDFFIAGGSGDVDGNGNLTDNDWLLILDYLNGIAGAPVLNADPAARSRADVNGDRVVNGMDAALIRKQLEEGGAQQAVTWRSFPAAQTAFGRAIQDRTVAHDMDLANGTLNRIALGAAIGTLDQALEIDGDLRLAETTAAGGQITSFALHNFGDRNMFFLAGPVNLSGIQGSGNTGYGEGSGFINGFGTSTLRSLTTGSRNTAFDGLHYLTTGSDNVGIRTQGPSWNVGSHNTAVYANGPRNGDNNTAMGYDPVVSPKHALGYQSTGDNNTALGMRSLGNNTTGSDNTALQGMNPNTTGNGNTALGAMSRIGGFSSTAASSSYNTAAWGLPDKDGDDNTAIWGLGDGGNYSDPGGTRNVAVGKNTMTVSSGTSDNTVIGSYSTGQNMVGASNNVSIGNEALGNSCSNCQENTVVGHNTLTSTSFVKNQSVVLGREAAYRSGGISAVLLGTKMAYNVGGTNSSLQVGDGDENPNGFLSGALFAVGSYLTINAKVGVGMGPPDAASSLDMAVSGAAHATSWSSASDLTLKRDLHPLGDVIGKIAQLHGVSFRWKDPAAFGGGAADRRQIGLIAQEVERVFPEVVIRSGEEGTLSVDYAALMPVMVEALKTLEAEHTALEKELDGLEQQLARRKGGAI